MITTIKPLLFNLGARRNSANVLAALPVAEGDRIADLGSGGGYYTYEFARRVGAGGIVYAVDPDSHNLRFVGQEIRRRGLNDRVILTLAEPDDFLLPAGSCDLVFSRNSFHHINTPETYFKKVAEALRPGGTLAVIDYDGPARVPYRTHFSNPRHIRESLAKAGFRLSAAVDTMPGRSFQIFSAF